MNENLDDLSKQHWIFKYWWLPHVCLGTSISIGVWHYLIWRDWWWLSFSAVIWTVTLSMIFSNHKSHVMNKNLAHDIEELQRLVDALRKLKDDGSDKWKGEE